MENEMLDKLAAIPGVDSVAFASAAPLERINSQNDLLYAQDKIYAAGQIPPIRSFRYHKDLYAARKISTLELVEKPILTGRIVPRVVDYGSESARRRDRLSALEQKNSSLWDSVTRINKSHAGTSFKSVRLAIYLALFHSSGLGPYALL
jgi:hypothetical protein